MKKKVLLLGAVALVLTACGGKSATEGETPDNIVRQTLANSNPACVDRYMPNTKMKIEEADKFAAEGQTDSAVKAENEAVELFKTEEPAFKAASDDLGAQTVAFDETVVRKNNIDANPNSNTKFWAEKSYEVDKLLEEANNAINYCDPEGVKTNIEKANKILSEVEQRLGMGGAAPANNSTVYVVQKGDSLWYIAAKQFSNPFMWPIIYWTNQLKIKDPDLIFPKQEFTIVFDSTDDEKARAENLAKTRGPWSLYDNK